MAQITDLKTITRPSSPNTYLVAPDGYCTNAQPDEAPPVFDASPATLYETVNALASSQSRWTTEASAPDTRHLEVVAATKILKFRDDITIDVLDAENHPGKSTLAIYSRSRVGYSDLGANKKRVQKLLKDIESELGKSP